MNSRTQYTRELQGWQGEDGAARGSSHAEHRWQSQHGAATQNKESNAPLAGSWQLCYALGHWVIQLPQKGFAGTCQHPCCRDTLGEKKGVSTDRSLTQELFPPWLRLRRLAPRLSITGGGPAAQGGLKGEEHLLSTARQAVAENFLKVSDQPSFWDMHKHLYYCQEGPEALRVPANSSKGPVPLSTKG